MRENKFYFNILYCFCLRSLVRRIFWLRRDWVVVFKLELNWVKVVILRYWVSLSFMDLVI